MTKLNQLLAIEKGVKSKANQVITEFYKKIQRSNLISGISRTYRPHDEEGEQLPAERTRVQLNAYNELLEASKAFSRLMDVTATKDKANTYAKANVVVDGRTLLEDVPVTTLLFLEKQLVDLQTVVSKLPELDPSETWHYDDNADAYATDPTETVRTKKVPRAFILAPATDKHPAQVQAYQEDISVGTWVKTAYSGAVPSRTVRELQERIATLLTAVKFAREEANGHDVTDVAVGDSIFNYVFNVPVF